jgi:hypothetical protein
MNERKDVVADKAFADKAKQLFDKNEFPGAPRVSSRSFRDRINSYQAGTSHQLLSR